MAKKEFVFKIDKETKGSVRYAEKTEGMPPVVGTIYVRKWAFKGDKYPTSIKVTLDL